MSLAVTLESGAVAVRGLRFARGRGARLWDDQGREYLDCASMHGIVPLGHAHPRVTAAIAEQAGRLIACSTSFACEVRERYLSELLALAAPLARAFLCNSGAEAIEAGIKAARWSTGRAGLVALARGFHGRTMGALSLTHRPAFRAPFEPLLAGVVHVAPRDPAALAAAVDDRTAAVVIEPVQGEGGVHPLDPEFLRAARAACDRHGALLVFDEVQTGFGRTGRWFAWQRHGVVPDVLCLAKGIANGVPMGAALFGPRVRPWEPGAHGSTFGGNPLACAAATATLAVLREERLPERAERLGRRWREELAALALPAVREVRGLGLMIGLECRQRVAPALQALQERGVIALPAGPQVLRLLPPLVIEEEEMARASAAIAEVLSC